MPLNNTSSLQSKACGNERSSAVRGVAPHGAQPDKARPLARGLSSCATPPGFAVTYSASAQPS
jgi:hypothetical protein